MVAGIFIISSQSGVYEATCPLICMKVQIFYYIIQKIRIDNVGEFSSHTFYTYSMSIGITIKHHVSHVITKLIASFIKELQLIARSWLIRTKFPTSTWNMLFCIPKHLYALEQLIIISTL